MPETSRALDRVGQAAGLSAEEQELLAYLWEGEDLELADDQIPRRSEVQDRIPLTFPQQRLWFLDQLQPGNPHYNVGTLTHLVGPLDVDALRRAFREVVNRHENLRTYFVAEDGEPAQRIAAAGEVELPFIDLEELDEKEEVARRMAWARARTAFDLTRAPMLRLLLFRFGPQEHVLGMTIHHIVYDGWSLPLLVHEVVTLYEAFARDEASPLPELPIQYADYALWQRERLAGETLQTGLSAWMRQLQGSPPVIALPTDRPHGGKGEFQGRKSPEMYLPDAVPEALGRLSRRQGSTLFTVFLAAFKAFLYRLTQQSDLVVGSPIANREQPEVAGLIGFFANTLVLRTRWTGDPAFSEVLEHTWGTVGAAFEHADFPFDRLVQELDPERDLRYNPVFQVMFAFVNIPEPRTEGGGVRFVSEMLDLGVALFDLTLILAEHDGRHFAIFEYDSDLFDATTIQRFLEQFGRLTRAIAEDPNRRLSQIPLLDPGARHQMLVEWNDTEAAWEGEPTLAGAFAYRAARRPEAVALHDGEIALTYGELARRVHGLARSLASLGVVPEVRAGLFLPRSADLVCALLAVAEAGGTYVPLDPDTPEQRLALLLEDAGVRVILTHRALAERLPEGCPARVFEVDLAETAGEERAATPRSATRSRNLAYVLYTSGSTGRPKGVLIEHRAILELAAGRHPYWAGLREARVALSAPVVFDPFLEQVLALVGGHTLEIVREETRREPRAFTEDLRDRRVDLLNCTPSQLSLLVDAGLFRDGGSPETVLVGGEACPEPLWTELAGIGQSRFWNLYGPTETTVDATAGRIAGPRPHLGRPIGNVRHHVLAPGGGEVPRGTPGELALAGNGLARGYLGAPALTAERFVPDPFCGVAGGRLYLSGDLARHLADGRLEFLGRLDEQVKIRGHRVELGEIEAVAHAHPEVEACAVVARDDAGTTRLTACLVARGAAASGDLPGALRRYLQERLPDYMVPAAYVELEALPLLATGKVDRRALFELEGAAAAEAGYLAPRDPVEELLAGIWAEVLGVERVGVRDDFFDLGGHSLLATRVISRVGRTFDVELPVRTLFEASVLEDLAGHVRGARRQDPGTQPPLVPVPRDRPLPLSFAQERLWFIDSMSPGLAAYNVPMAVRLRGDLEVPALAASLRAIVARHEILRTTFRGLEGRPVQDVAAEAELPLPVVDLAGLPGEARERQARSLARREIHRPFDLGRGPLARALLLRLDEHDHQVITTLHHIVSDGWSTGVLIRELAALYRALAAGQRATLPALPVQYGDFAVWQRRWLRGDELARQLAWWREELTGAPQVLELPLDRPRPPVHSFRGRHHPVSFPTALTGELAALARRQGATLFMVLLAAFQALLHRLSGQDDLLLGTPVANRRRPEVEGLIGFFVNLLVTRSRRRHGASFTDLLAETRESNLAAWARQDLPFEKLVEELEPEREPSRPPLVQVLFAFQNAPGEPLELPGLELEFPDFGVDAAKLDLSFSLAETGGVLAGDFEYNADLFDATTVERFARHLGELLAGAVADPERRWEELPLLGASERHQLVEWNATRLRTIEARSTSVSHASAGHASAGHASAGHASAGRPASRVDRQVEELARRAPDVVAVIGGDHYLSYGVLVERSAVLASRLHRLGVGPEVKVALLLEREPELMIAILGISRAGGVAVFLDPGHPPERLTFQLEDSRPRVVIGRRDQEALARAPEGAGWTVLTPEELGAGGEAGDPGPADLPARASADESLAYVIYTSGSTGRPKGVELTQRGLANLVWGHGFYNPCRPDTRMIQLSSLSFDAAVFEIWPCLARGATLCIVDAEVRSDPEALVRWLSEREITSCFLATPLLEAVLPLPWPERSRLELVMTGGDRLRQYLPPDLKFELLNLYGPTENTVAASGGRVARAPAPAGVPSAPAIGRPMAGCEVWILDRELAPVGPGVFGELCVAGRSLARGYLGRPARTAAAFIPDPLADRPGGRLYLTGDLARHLADGAIEFLGREDHQVKIRGFRIELGEIEAQLSAHPHVLQVAVLARPGVTGGHARLTAYVVLAEESAGIDALRAFLHQRLPDYMVPTAWVMLDSLPLTTSGKVDRAALPEPEVAGSASSAPRTSTEELLAAIWGEILEVEEIGRNDNFFELGGHSLMATRVSSRIARDLGVELPVRDLFENPTVAGLAPRVDRALGARGARDLPAIRRVPRDGELPLSYAQERLWFLSQLETVGAAYNLPIALRLRGGLQVAALRAAIEELVRRHEALRTTFTSLQGRAAQVIHPPAPWTLPVIDLEGPVSAERIVHQVLRSEARRLFDLERGPLLRTLLVRLADEEHVLLVVAHHIVADGGSMGVLVEELTALYRSTLAGSPSPLPEPAVQYADYAVWQRGWLGLDDPAAAGDSRDGGPAAQAGYWQARLRGAPPLDLPSDRPRPLVQTFQGSYRRFRLARAAGRALRALGRRQSATLFMTLAATFEVLLHRLTGQSDVTVGTPIAGRNRSELENLVGFFVNTLVLRNDLEGGELTFLELLARVRETALGAYGNQDLPFERLIDELEIERDLSRTPLFQVVFVLQNASRGKLELPGLTFEPVPVSTGTAKFDLTLSMSDEESLDGQLEFNADLFDGATADRLVRHFEVLAEGIAGDPERRLADLPLLAPASRHQLAVEWGRALGAPARSGEERLLHELFAGWVERSPDAVALSAGEEQVSYGELGRQAGRLAERLRSCGAGPEVLVGICLERSVELVTAILGILEAGAAYVPLDPNYPEKRLSYLAADSRLAILVTRRGLGDRRPAAGEGDGPLVVYLDELGPYAEAEPGTALPTRPDHPAYVIYTSGSTGQPKGVIVSHRNAARLLHATEPWFGFGPTDVWTLFHSFAFDFSVWELWGALAYGGRLVVVPFEVSREPESFHGLLGRERVSVLNQTPSAFRQLIPPATASPAGLALEHVIFGGEALEPASLKDWVARFGDRRPRLINMYGITETTVHVTYRPLAAGELEAPGSPIGRPIPDLALHVLDRRGEPVPIGVPGELHVGGAGLARGYLGRPGLSAERFVPDRFGGAAGARLYRTGDLGRRMPGGEIEYLGRIDHQIKIRGFRVELGEIETTLSEHPDVGEAVVLLRDDLPGAPGDRLVAWFVPRAESTPAAGEFHKFLGERLPAHMVPAAFMALEALPLTAHGKLDRRALPAPAAERPELETLYEAPENATEEILAGVFGQVLGIPRVGVRDDFFALGGDSILSIRVLALARERGLEIALEDLFRHPSVTELAGVLGRASEQSEEGERSAPLELVSDEDRPLLPADVEDAYPLTRLQAGMLFHMGMFEEEPPYHNCDSWHLRGRLDFGRFERAAERAVARHPVLRTSFDLETYSEPLQLVHRRAPEPMVVIVDLRHLSPEACDETIESFLLARRSRPLDVARPPLLRLFLHLRSEETFQFTLIENHAILDGWSLHATLAEIFQEAFGGAVPPSPPADGITFRDYVALERRAMASVESRRFWHDRLAGAPFVEVPRRERRARASEDLRVPNRLIPLAGERGEALRRVAGRAAVPLKSVFLAAHLQALSLFTGRRDLVLGFTTNGRPEVAGGDDVRGLFLNSLPLRLATGPEIPWIELVRRAFLAEKEMLPHRRYPLALLQSELGRGQLTEISFNYVHFHVASPVVASGRLELIDTSIHDVDNFTLSTTCGRKPGTGELYFQIAYDADELAATQVARLARLYEAVFEALGEDPEGLVGTVPSLFPEERHQLLREWNDTAGPSEDRGLGELFEARVESTPEAVALVWEGRHLSYAELDARANQLARFLRRLGAGPERTVALCFERCPEMVLSLLAVLKTGAAYLPLAPSYPPERLAYMLEDSGAGVLVTREDEPEGRGWDGSCVHLARDRERIAGESRERLAPRTAPDSLAYVIYTSGSTGRPKGVLGHHRGAVNRLLWAQRAYPVRATDRVLHKAPFSFDFAVWEILAPLIAGATSVLARAGGEGDPAYLVRKVRDERVTLLHFVPPMLQAFLAHDEVPALTSLRYVFSGGDLLPPETVARFRELVPARLRNQYGPTEISIDTTDRLCEPEDEHGPVPLGRPIAGNAVYVLDRELRPSAVSVAGELCLGGTGVTRGYHRRPALTAERFVPSPFGEVPGARLYRTGDAGRVLADGLLSFSGRIDHQVKIRGFRVEPGEIEAALERVEGVRQAVVVALPGPSGDPRLVAYVVAGGKTPAELLRAALDERLPEYMVPSRFIFLDAFPLTPNAKVDRRALPAPDWEAGEGDFEGPRTPAEELLLQAWREVLGVEQVSLRDDFFELGGHSLLATQVVSRIRSTLGVEVPLRSLFEKRTVAGLAAEVESARRVALPPIEPLGAVATAPLSHAQERLWFLDQLAPGSAHYNLPARLRLCGPLDLAALAESLRRIVERHDTLRTTFGESGGRPLQRIAAAAELPLPLVDLTALAEADRESALRGHHRDEAARPFDLARGPLLRVAVSRLAAEEHAAILNMHHIVSDGWSTGILVRELMALYQGLRAGRPVSLPELAVRFSDFAAWQRRWLSGELLERELDWWREELDGAPQVLELPADRPRPSTPTFRGRLERLDLPADLGRRLRELSESRRSTLFMTLLAAFETLLARFSGQEDLLVGSPVAHRNRREIEGLIGFFVNTLVLRGRLAGDPSFGELLGRTRETTLAAFAHQDLPFERLVEALDPVRDPSRAPLFQAMFVLQNAPAEALELPDLRLEWLEPEAVTAKFDLTLTAIEAEGELMILAEGSRDLFDRSTLRRLLRSWRRLLESAAEDPGRRLSELALLSPAEHHQLLIEWSASAAPPAGTATLLEAFELRATRTPDAVAVVAPRPGFGSGGDAGEVQLSFRELDRRAEALAGRLRRAGVGTDDRLVVALERSLELVVSVLAAHKAGAAYVPIEPDHPRERTSFVIEESGAAAIVTREALRDGLAGNGTPVLTLDTAADGDVLLGSGPPARHRPDPGQAAYVIYTSGSTGRPKGVAVSHRAIARRVHWLAEQGYLTAADAVLQKTTPVFDASVWEIYGPLVTGARLAVAGADSHREPAALVDDVRRHGISVLQVVPTFLGYLLGEPELGHCRSLRRVFSGGEALTAELERRFGERLGGLGVELHNTYGPTEAAIDVAHHALGVPGRSPGGGAGRGAVPIGRPLPGSRLLVVDRAFRPVPRGAPGALLIGGVQLARGYFRRPRRTAAAFLPDPLSSEPGARLYRTGDLARFLPTGEIEFLGRLDHQVKLRGFRIELGEIESLLREHAAVSEAVVTVDARDSGAGSPGARLVAYLVLADDPDSDAGDLTAEWRELLAERVPDYMVPAAFVVLDELPRLPSGKLDRGALPAPEASPATSRVAPRTPAEEMLAGLWADLLGLDEVGVFDSFFSLGGHSLVATRVVSRVREIFRVELGVGELFERPTVAALAAEIDRRSSGSEGLAAPPIEPVPRDRGLPLSFSQQRLWFLQQLEPESPAYHLPGALRLDGALDAAALAGALRAIVARHESLRTAILPSDGQPVQTISAGVSIELPLLDLSALDGDRRGELLSSFLLAESRRPFDLTRPPLLRAALLRLGERSHVLFFNLHHLVSDGWSAGVLTRELNALYRTLTTGEPPSLPSLPVQYADFAAWQRQRLSGEVLERQLDFWRRWMDGAPEILNLMTDRPRRMLQSYRGAVRSRALPRELTGRLRDLGRRRSATLYMTLLAGFNVLLQRYGAGDDLVVGSNVAGRPRAEVEDLIGFFVNAVVLRTRLSGDPTWSEALARTRDTVLGAFAHQDLPFDQLVEALQPRRDLSASPIFQVQFDLVQEDPAAGRLDLPGLEAAPLAFETRTAKFDLTLAAGDVGELIVLEVEYSTDLFDGTTAERWLRHLESLLAGAVADPELPVSELPLMSPAEAHQLRRELQGPARAYPLDVPLDRLFLRQAVATPGAVALVCRGEHLSYGELEDRSARLAAALRRGGLERGELVALLAERGPDVLVGMVAALRAGGAFVPIDPSYPEDRVRYMITDCGARHLLLGEGMDELLPPDGDAPELEQIFCFGEPVSASGTRRRVFEVRDLEAAERGVLDGFSRHPGDPSYLLYTSGSTGRPKGAVLHHAAKVNHIWAQFEDLALGPELCFLQSAPSSSDISVWQFLGPVLVGGRVVVADLETLSDPPRLLSALQRHAITLAELVPEVLRGLLVHAADLPPARRSLPCLRSMMMTGEAVPAELVNAWLELYPGIEAINAYGPTEAADDVVQEHVRSPLPEQVAAPAIGRPLANLECHVLDRRFRPVPLGVPGELGIAGAGVGQGYWRKPRRTGESFVPHPAAARPGEVLYRTGDLVRWRADGTLDFLGRIDHQVKLRGFRIELGEIERSLDRHPAVSKSVVVLHGEGLQKGLVAYCVPAGETLPAETLRNDLRERLPAHMVPATFVELDEIPLTPAGKTDRRALPEPGVREIPLVPPRTPAESRLAEIWAEVLELDEVSVEADFFELGGHSLVAVQILARIRATLQVEIPLREFFNATTIATFAPTLERAEKRAATPAAPIQRRARRARRVEESVPGILKDRDRPRPGVAGEQRRGEPRP